MRKLTHMTVVLAGLASFGPLAQSQCNQNCPERRTISAPGTAQVAAEADLAIVHVGYKLFGPDAKTAYVSALDTSNAIMQALTSSGIPKSSIESTGQSIQHTQPFDLNQFPMKDEERKSRQFTVSQSWTIRVKPDQAGDALNTAINAGANESGWIQWIVQDPTSFEAKASAQAAANARVVAEQIAQKSGVRLGRLESVSQNQNPAFYAGYGGSAGSFGMGNAIVSSLAMQPGQQMIINSRRVEFTITIYATFSVEDLNEAKP